jgi:hypothetical protein
VVHSAAATDQQPAASADRWVGVGQASGDNPRAEAAEATAASLRGDDPKLIIVFASDALELGELVAGIRSQAPQTPLIGCSSAGEIASSGPADATAVITAFGGPGFSIATAVGRRASAGPRAAGAAAAACLDRVPARGETILLMLSDGMAGDQQEIVRGAYSVAGAGIPLVGGCAGDDLRLTTTRQLCGDEVMTDAVVAAAISSSGPLGIGVRHGWRRSGEPMLVTESEGNHVRELDGELALDVYLAHTHAPAAVHEDPREFVRFSRTRPLGLDNRHGEERVRAINGADFDARTLQCIAEVPQGALVWIMDGDDASVLAATDSACEDALAPLGEAPPLGLMAFDCIARRSVLGEDGIKTEIDRVAANGSGAPVAGFYTYGEIARTRGISAFHNQTLVVLAVG